MTPADLPLGMRLKREAGWNQTEADWRRFLGLEPEGCFVAAWEGEACGTTTTCVLGRVAWIAMVLVAGSARGRGIGTALLEHALAYLDGRGVPTVRLDATAAGQPLYERLGFRGEYELARWVGEPALAGAGAAGEKYGPERQAAVAALDARVTGAERGRLLAWLARETTGGRVTVRGGEVTGYLFSRTGETAGQIGPGAATREADGEALLRAELERWRGRRVLVDIPRANAAATALARAAGLAEQRTFLRMCRGEAVRDRPEWLWASSGAEMG
jgi:GNAT superfamily N-acetyltransferase